MGVGPLFDQVREVPARTSTVAEARMTVRICLVVGYTPHLDVMRCNAM